MNSLIPFVVCVLRCFEHIVADSTTKSTPSISKNTCEAYKSFVADLRLTLDRIAAELDQIVTCSSATKSCEMANSIGGNRFGPDMLGPVTIPPALNREEEAILRRIERVNEEHQRLRSEMQELWSCNEELERRRCYLPTGHLGPTVSERPPLTQQESESREEYIQRLLRDAWSIQLELRRAREETKTIQYEFRRIHCNPNDKGASLIDGRYCRVQLIWYYTPEQQNYVNVGSILRQQLEERVMIIAQSDPNFPQTVDEYLKRTWYPNRWLPPRS